MQVESFQKLQRQGLALRPRLQQIPARPDSSYTYSLSYNVSVNINNGRRKSNFSSLNKHAGTVLGLFMLQ